MIFKYILIYPSIHLSILELAYIPHDEEDTLISASAMCVYIPNIPRIDHDERQSFSPKYLSLYMPSHSRPFSAYNQHAHTRS